MEIIIDTSALLAVLVNEPHKGALVRLTQGAELIAPQSVHWEIGNALSAMFKRGRISLEQAQACLKSYQLIPVRFAEVPLERAVEVAHRHGIYAYDAYLIVCAQQFGGPLLTLDAGLRQMALKEGLSVLEVAP
jgi:predicted nucleic acid-binding protein